jgi:hypothetical protein
VLSTFFAAFRPAKQEEAQIHWKKGLSVIFHPKKLWLTYALVASATSEVVVLKTEFPLKA